MFVILNIRGSMSSKRKCDNETDVVEKKAQIVYPSVSIIVALYNAELFIEECLDSILTQTYQGTIEVSIHDDASTDKSAQVVEVGPYY